MTVVANDRVEDKDVKRDESEEAAEGGFRKKEEKVDEIG